jgi:hypothetical protein
VVSGVALIVAFGLAFWQNHAPLDVLNRPRSAKAVPRPPCSERARAEQSLRSHSTASVRPSSCSRAPLFGYFVMRPEAVGFLQNFNATSVGTLVQPRRLLLTGADPVTTGLELLPMLLPYELSIVAAGLFERRFPHGVDEKNVEHGHP